MAALYPDVVAPTPTIDLGRGYAAPACTRHLPTAPPCCPASGTAGKDIKVVEQEEARPGEDSEEGTNPI